MLSNYKYTEKELKTILSSICILVDTREKEGKNNHILEWFDKKKISYKFIKLDCGDYSCFIPKNKDLNIDRDLYFNTEIAIERKASLEELAGNFTKERARIKHEFAQHEGSITLLIENANYEDVYNGNYKSEYNAKSFVGTLHSIKEEYNVPFIFMNKEYSARYIYNTMYYYIRRMLKK